MTDELNNVIDQQGEPGSEVSDGAASEQADAAVPVAEEGAPVETQPGGQEVAEPESAEAQPTTDVPAAELVEPVEVPGEEPTAPSEAPPPTDEDKAAETPTIEPEETPPVAEEPAEAGPEETPPVAEEPVEAGPEETPPVAEEPVEAGPEETPPVAEEPAEEPEAPPEEEKSDEMDWYILKVQSNREDSIREGLLRRVKIAGLERFFGDVIVPTEKVTEVKAGKKRVMKRKLYPGYIVVNMEVNDDTWFLVRETPGIGDFTGAAGNPTPMAPHEVVKIVTKEEEKAEKSPLLKIGFKLGDRVKIVDGNFENFEGDVEHIDQANGRVTVMINIFNRSTPVTLEYWQIEAV